MNVEKLTTQDIPELMDIWAKSVRAKHHFLSQEDFLFYQSVGAKHLKKMALYGIRQGQIIGFLGVQNQHIEMLFVHPNFFKKGVGKTLLRYALEELNATTVDVNEQNQYALKFYQSFDFQIINHSELDPTGRPYPILHLRLTQIQPTS